MLRRFPLLNETVTLDRQMVTETERQMERKTQTDRQTDRQEIEWGEVHNLPITVTVSACVWWHMYIIVVSV